MGLTESQSRRGHVGLHFHDLINRFDANDARIHVLEEGLSGHHIDIAKSVYDRKIRTKHSATTNDATLSQLLGL